MTNANEMEVIFAPLGGVGEIGMNCALYGLGQGKVFDYLMVDLGMSFADATVPGVDLMLPDIRFAVKERKRLHGLVITHGHEDHIGAVLHLWPSLNVPIYTTRFTAALLQAKLRDFKHIDKLPITIVEPLQQFQVGPFTCEMVPVAHSIPDACALAIHTSQGVVVHTGDWKLDHTPVLGNVIDEKRLRELGEKGVLACICDSTNANREGVSPSEAVIAGELEKCIRAAKGRVAITLFSSNVARIASIANATKAAGRQLVILGRALERMVTIAKDIGLLQDDFEILGQDTYGYLPRENTVVLLTGSQGEERAMLAKLTYDGHPRVALSAGDTLIFSSRTIPGNERAVLDIQNALTRRGIEIITDKTHLVHVSGHPRRDELKTLYSWLKPSVLVPVHGEAMHLYAHAELARSQGIPNVLQAIDGDWVQLAPTPSVSRGKLPIGKVYVDGELIVPAHDASLEERNKLKWSGVVSVALGIGRNGEIATDLDIMIHGLPEKGKGGQSILELIRVTVEHTISHLPKPQRRQLNVVEIALEKAIRSACQNAWGKKPVCHIHVLEV